CLIASVESRAKYRIARLRTHEVDHWKRILRQSSIPVDLIIHPETDITERILRVINVPGLSDIFDFAEGRVKLFGTSIDANNRLANKSIKEINSEPDLRHGLIAMIFRGQEAIIPHGNEILLPGDQIYFMTRAEDLEDAYLFMGLRSRRSFNRVFIFGGKQLGIELALRLENVGVSVKLFEEDADRCELISRILKKAIVIHGNGKDEMTLMEKNIKDVDAFLALSADDEDNIMASLLARKLGADKIVVLINQLNYLPMVQRLGITTTVSPRLTAADLILRFTRKGRVISVTSFREQEAESIEIIAEPGSRLVGKKLKDLGLPRDCIIGAIIRPGGEVIVPQGEDHVHAGDRIIFFALERMVPKLESLFFPSSRS
ncbi:MAG TPA: Trk system potassium transporter TrkA, partial [Acidobacteriota bacterium]|nr:Trk system potassium transporter TrkA [Acidobacteriota bacterium]